MDWDGEGPDGRKVQGVANWWAGSGRAPDVAMMQATEFGNRDDRADFRRLNGPSVGCILVERE